MIIGAAVLKRQDNWEDFARLPATVCLLIATACAIARQFGGEEWLTIPAATALLVFIALQWQGITMTYRIFSVVTPGLATGLWLSDKIDAQTIANGVDRAAFFTFFLTSLAVLRESAKSSTLVRECGKALVNQPPARRYMLMSFGSHLFSIMLNIGALNVLGTMVQRAVRITGGGDAQRLASIRKKRMLTATLRGFCGVPLWAPTSVTMLLVLSSLPQLTWEQYAPVGLVWTVLFILWGALLDWLAYPRPRTIQVADRNLSVLIPFVVLVGLIPTLAYFLSRITGLDIFPMLLMCAPVIGVIWIWYQYRRADHWLRLRLVFRRMKRSFPKTFTVQRNEVVLFASSGFLGVILIPLVDPEVARNFLVHANVSNATIMVSLSLIMLICSFLGINAIITVTLLLGTLQQVPGLDIAPMVQASVVAITWAVFAGASPFTASLRFIAGFSGVSALRLGVVWNGWFNVSVLAIMYMVLYIVL
ncbi:hypothetical protein C7H09_05225 [Marinobacter fuscus]|uniref:Citrate transporter n=1 Tax=Marinobacter fuscus TaxID=2109942 RepID=A0A2T1KPK5_9GAMM|nr:hypothetical protein C7H09_05225 [Marinobacter fuscus]